jgi:hypothetical protein
MMNKAGKKLLRGSRREGQHGAKAAAFRMAAVRPRVDKTRIFAARLVTDGHVRLNTRRIEAGMEEIQRFKGKTGKDLGDENPLPGGDQ